MFSFRPSDAVLVRGALSGRAEAFEALIERHQRKAHAVARAQGVGASSIDDVVQDSFLKAFRELPQLRDSTKFASWLVLIVRNTACTERRRGTLARVSTESLESAASPPSETLEGRELRELLRRKVDALPERIREAIFLYYYEGQSTARVAQALGTTRAAVKKRLQKGRDTLRAELWRELHEELRDLLPSVRRWKEKARVLALAAAVSPGAWGDLNASANAAGGLSWVSGSGLVLGGVTVKSNSLLALILMIVVAGVTLWTLQSTDEPVVEPVARDQGNAARPNSVDRKPLPPPPEQTAPAIESNGVLQVAAPPALSVHVVDADGAMVSGASVRVRWTKRADGQHTTIGGTPETLAEEKAGIYASSEMLRGDAASLATAARGFALDHRTLEDLESGMIVTVELQPIETARLRLIAPLEGDRPVAGALVGPIAGDLVPGQVKARLGYPPSMFRRGETVNRLYTVASDDNGEVAVSSEPGRLWVTHEDYGPCALVISSLRMPRGDTVHAVPLYPPTDVRIRVRRADDKIVEGFRYGIGDDVWREPPRNAEGAGAEVLHPMYLRFYLDPHARLTDEFVVTATDGDPRGSARWKLQPGVENAVEIVLDAQPTSILGVVSDADGQPVEGAQVTAISGEKGFVYVIQNQVRGADVPRVKTSSGGRYELLFADTPAPIWLVVTHPEQPFFMSERLELLPKQARQHDIRLFRGATLVARYRPEHLAEGDLQVTLSNENGAEYPVIDYRRSEPPDEHGAVRFERVGAGAWTVQWMDGKVFRRQPVYLEDGESYTIQLESPPREGAVRVSGTLLADAQPVPDIGLWLWDGASDQVTATQQTDAAGAFDLGWVSPGTHRLGVGLHSRSKSNEVPLHYRIIDIRPETVPLVVDVSTRVLVGRVVDTEGPVAAVTIRAFSKQQIEQKAILTTFNRAQSGAGGEYRLGGVYDVPCVLVYEKSGYVPRRIPWTPTGPKEAGFEDVLLEKAEDHARIRIRVVERETDTPIAHVQVQLDALGYDAPLGTGGFQPTSSLGEFVTEPQPVGRYRVFVRPGGPLGLQQYTGEAVEFDHTAGGGAVTVRCRRGGSVRLDLKAAGGLPPTRAFVEVKDDNGQTILNWRGTRTLAFSGSAVLFGLPLGEVRVTVKAPGWTTLEFPLTVSPGRVARVTRRMERED